jgi:hypothetical protein
MHRARIGRNESAQGWVIKPKELLNISHALSPEDIADAVIDILNNLIISEFQGI